MAPGVTERACCPARLVVRVIMSATATRPEPVDLLLCGHHYRVSRALRDPRAPAAGSGSPSRSRSGKDDLVGTIGPCGGLGPGVCMPNVGPFENSRALVPGLGANVARSGEPSIR
jgi:hypothetical protein